MGRNELRPYIFFINLKEFIMRLFLAIFIPFSVFFTIGHPISGIIALILQITIIGWLPATLWAVTALNSYNTDKKIEAAQLNNRNL